jgi:hypothetical protein
MQQSGFMGTGGGTQSKPDGSFTINGLAPGTYVLRAATGPSPDEVATAEVAVSGSDVTDLQLVATKMSVMRGRVVFEPGPIPPPAATAVRVSATSTGGSAALGMAGGGGVPKNDWTFEIKSHAAQLRIGANVIGPAVPNQRANPIGWRLKRVVLGDSDITDAGFDLPSNATIENIVVEMTTRVSQVDVTVVDEAGAAVQDCVVVLFAQDSQRWTWPSRFFAAGRPDQDGAYHGRVPAGAYFAVAFDDPEAILPLFGDPDILLQLRDGATPITVGDAETKPIQLKLSPPPVY